MIIFSGGMCDLHHLPLCEPEEDVTPSELKSACGSTGQSNRPIPGQSKALSNIRRPTGFVGIRSGRLHFVSCFLILLLIVFRIFMIGLYCVT